VENAWKFENEGTLIHVGLGFGTTIFGRVRNSHFFGKVVLTARRCSSYDAQTSEDSVVVGGVLLVS